MGDAKFASAASILDGWKADVFSGQSPPMFPIGKGELANVEFGPGRVVLLGGAPGAGKTAFAMQAVFDALRLSPGLRVVVCNVEMSPRALLDRQLSRFSRINLRTIRSRKFTISESEQLHAGMAEVSNIADRIAFVHPPYGLEHITKVAVEFNAGAIVLDYIQRIQPPGKQGEKRLQLEASMGCIRQLAEAGQAVLVIAAVSRSKDSKGRNSYGNLSLASFRESSELEYGADDAFILAPGTTPTDPLVTLTHLKSRYGETRDIPLRFERSVQLFVPFGSDGPPRAVAGRNVIPMGGTCRL